MKKFIKEGSSSKTKNMDSLLNEMKQKEQRNDNNNSNNNNKLIIITYIIIIVTKHILTLSILIAAPFSINNLATST
jgi:hypothetical protein